MFEEMNSSGTSEGRKRVWLPVASCVVVACCCILYLFETWCWPLVGDAVSVHYLILLMRHGMAPYRQIVDAQMPGTYLVDWIVLHVYGGGRAGLRLFDFSLVAASAVAMLAIAWPMPGSATQGFFRDGRYAACIAGGLFAVVHGRDGIEQAGQRDLIMALLLLATCALAFHALRKQQARMLGLSGFCAALGLTIKPTVLPAAGFLLLMALVRGHQVRQKVWRYWAAVSLGLCIPFAALTIFLLVEHSGAAFGNAVSGMWPYYATLQRRSTGYLLIHSFSPLASICIIWLALKSMALINWLGQRRIRTNAAQAEAPAVVPANAPWAHTQRAQARWERVALNGSLALSLLSFVTQGKGFVYHRYPFLAFLLLVLLIDFHRAFDATSEEGDERARPTFIVIRPIGAAGLIAAALFLAPVSTYKISRFDWRNDDYYQQLSADLDRLGGSALSGHLQCMDAFSGCISTLYRMDLVQSTGFLVDFYFFAPKPNVVIDSMRRHFWQDLQQNPPRVFIVSKQVFPVTFSSAGEPLDTYEKLKRWPQFDAYLEGNYTMVEDHTWSRPVLWASHADHPAGYRLYVRKDRLRTP